MERRIIIIVLCSVMLTLSSHFGAKGKYRLPDSVIPTSYKLYVEPPCLEENIYKGEIKIYIDILKETEKIILHSSNLTIQNVFFDSWEVDCILDPEYELLEVSLPFRVTPRKSVLEIIFTGSFEGKINGFYRSTFKGDNDTERYMALTKFEPTYARQAFPCFDEPHLKASFQLAISQDVDRKVTVLSNTGVLAEEGAVVKFKETVPMSTYLVAYIVTDYTSDKTVFRYGGNEILVRVFTDDSAKKARTFALEIAPEIMNYFCTYTDIGYPMDKIDLISVPNKDFRSGAMENWGLITFRETRLLFDPDQDSIIQQRSVALVVAHELAHFWFGNLVTLKWWNDVWLNEGFAKYMEYKAVDAFFKNWNLLKHFQVLRVHRLLHYDYYQVSEPIVNDVLTPPSIKSQFNMIKYSKGGAVLRMLENWVGEQTFRLAIKTYLKENLYKNTETVDFTRHFDNNTQEMLSTYLLQKRYPLISVKVDKERQVYVLTQEKLSFYQNDTTSPFEYRWTVPITYTYSFSKNPEKILFHHYQKNITIPIKHSRWIKFNHHQTGLYRINYPDDMWLNLRENYKSLEEPDRAHLIEEVLFLQNLKIINCTIAMKFLHSLASEVKYMPWASLKRPIYIFATKLNTTDRVLFQDYISYLTATAMEKYAVTRDSDSAEERLARIAILDINCYVRAFYCIHLLNTVSKDDLTPDLKKIYARYFKVMTSKKYKNILKAISKLTKLQNVHVYLFNSLLNGIVREPNFEKLLNEENGTEVKNNKTSSKLIYKNNLKASTAISPTKNNIQQSTTEENDYTIENIPLAMSTNERYESIPLTEEETGQNSGEEVPLMEKPGQASSSVNKDFTANAHLAQGYERMKRQSVNRKCKCKARGEDPSKETPKDYISDCAQWLHGYKNFILNLDNKKLHFKFR